MIIITTSSQDPAGRNMRKYLSEHHFTETADFFEGSGVYKNNNIRLIESSRQSIECDHISQHFPEAELIIFATKHWSQSGTPTLTVHAPGNWGKAEAGGKEGEVHLTSASALKMALLKLKENQQKYGLNNYELSMEATHHGPTENAAPCIFVEVGSSEEQWNDMEAVKCVAETALYVAENWNVGLLKQRNWIPALAFGGTHYPEKFTKLQLESEYAISHVLSKYASEAICDGLLEKAIKGTFEPVTTAIIDWKGLKGEAKQRTAKFYGDRGLNVIKA